MEVYYGEPLALSLSDMAAKLGVTIYPEDKVEALPNPSLGIGSQITIMRATKINVVDAKKQYIYRTWQENIAGLLKEKGIELLGQDSVSPDLTSKLIYNMNIFITRTAEVEVIETEAIDFKTINKKSADLEKGQTEIEQKGIAGEKQVKYLIKRVDGEEISRVVLETNITKQPVNQIVIVGIGPKLAKSGPYLSEINGAAKKYLINGTALMCLMMAESGGSADTGYPDATYKGLFQYTDDFWSSASSSAGYGGSSIYNATAQIYTTAWALTHGQSGRWPPWGRCSGK